MFQKLYRHLEEINTNLRQDKNAALGEQITEQLQSVNTAIHSQNEILLSQQKALLEAGSQDRSGTSRPWQVVNASIASIGIVVIIALTYYTWQLAQLTKKIPNTYAQPPVAIKEPTPATQPDAAMQQHLAMLDSLIAEQSRSIKELKNLNGVAVATFKNLKKHFSRTDQPPTARSPQPIDSLSLAK